MKKEVQPPKIRGAKILEKNPVYHFYLNKVERQVLFKKYISQGLDNFGANKKLKATSTYLNILVEKLRKKGLDDEQIQVKFHKEFDKFCNKY